MGVGNLNFLIVWIVLAVVSKASIHESSASTTEKITHPFLYLTEDRRATVLENIQKDPMASIYEDLIAKAHSDFFEIDLSDWDAKNHGKNGEIAVANAFLAWLNNDKQAAERSIKAMEILESNWDDHTSWGINIRMPGPLIHYTAAWDFLKATSFFTDQQASIVEEKLVTITQQFYTKYILDDSIRQLSLTVAQNNHPIRTAAAIGFVALAFQDHPSAKDWLDWSVSELDYLLGPDGKYIQADGAISEGPFYFNYGFAPAIAFFVALENRQSESHIYHRNCINRSDADPWTGHGCINGEEFTFTNPMRTELFRKIMDWSLSLRLPSGNRAPIADSPLRNQNGSAVFTYFGGADYLYWDWESNPSDPYKVKGGFELPITHLAYVKPVSGASPPSWKNRFFKDGGMAVFRSGWESDDRVLILMGESGSARKTIHDHSDGTSFVMAAYGDLLITDTGYYKPNSFDNAVTSSASSHNLILVDGEGVPKKGLLNDWGDSDAFIENILETEEVAYAESRQTYQETDFIRGIAFVRGRYFVVADHLEAEQDTTREYRFRLHAFAGKDLDGTVTLSEYGPHIQRENGSVIIYTKSSQGDCIHKEPNYVENSSPHVHKLEKDAEHHMVTDSVIKGKAPDFLTILAPYRSENSDGFDRPLNVTPIDTENGVAWEIIGDDGVDIAWIREESAPNSLVVPTGETITTDGTFVWVSLDSSLGLLVRGTELSVNNVIVVSQSLGSGIGRGNEVITDTKVEESIDLQKFSYALKQNYPNPFNANTNINYSLSKSGLVSLKVYNIAGQLVRDLIDQYQSLGSYRVVWDGLDESGLIVGNGIYFCEMKVGEYRALRKMLVTK